MADPSLPPAQPPRVPIDAEPAVVAEAERDRTRTWLFIVTALAVLALAAAGYAISEIESAKDDNREGDQAVKALRADVEVMREQLTERLDDVERRTDDAATADAQQKLQDDLNGLDKRVEDLSKQDGGGETDELTTRIDELEQRIEDLEDDSSN